MTRDHKGSCKVWIQPLSPPAKCGAHTGLGHWRVEKKSRVMQVSKSDAKQNRLIDDQPGLTLMRPLSPAARPGSQHAGVSPRRSALLDLVCFLLAGAAIVSFNYSTTKWYR